MAGETGEVIDGKTLAIVRDGAAVTVKQGDRVVFRYRYAGNPIRPHVSTLTSPGGDPALAELAFGWRVDGADFSGKTGESGRQVHKVPHRIDGFRMHPDQAAEGGLQVNRPVGGHKRFP